MKALSVRQPFAHLITLPDCDKRAKRIENRVWSLRSRWDTPLPVTILIHAAKNRVSWGRSSCSHGLHESAVAWGALVAAVDVVHCLTLADALALAKAEPKRWGWIPKNPHLEGPLCWILANVHTFAEPIPFPGKLGLFDVPDHLVASQLKGRV